MLEGHIPLGAGGTSMGPGRCGGLTMWHFFWVLVHRCVNSFSRTFYTYAFLYALFQYKEVEKVSGKKSRAVRFLYTRKDSACMHFRTPVWRRCQALPGTAAQQLWGAGDFGIRSGEAWVHKFVYRGFQKQCGQRGPGGALGWIHVSAPAGLE